MKLLDWLMDVEDILELGITKIIILGIVIFFIVGVSLDYFNKKEREEKSYIACIENNDFEGAHKDLLNEYKRASEKVDESYSERPMNSFWDKADYVYKAEMMYLINMHDQSANDRLIYELSKMTVIGDKPIENKKYGINYYDRETSYAVFINRYNRLCNEILDIAIRYKNKDMAERILKLYKESWAYEDITDKKDDKEYRIFKMSNQSLDDATKKFNKAVKEGEFN